MGIFKTLLCMFFTIFMINCSSDSSGGGTTTTAATTVSGALTSAQSKVAAVVPDTSGIAAFRITDELERVAMTTEWTTLGSQYSHGGDFGASPRVYVLNHGNEAIQGGLMFRLNQMLESLCIFATALPSTNGLPDLTSGDDTTALTAAVKADIVTNCGVNNGDLPPDDTVVGYRVDNVSAATGSQYERRVSFDLNGGNTFTDFFYFTINATLNRFSYTEDGTNDSYAAYEYSATTGVAKFEFHEEATGSNFQAHYRGILVEGSDLGRFVAEVVKTDTNDISTAIVSTQEGGGDELHVSYSFDDFADTDDFVDGNACIDTTDFSIATDNTLTCGGIAGAASSGFTYDTATNTVGANILATDETSVIQFTSLTDILTADSAL